MYNDNGKAIISHQQLAKIWLSAAAAGMAKKEGMAYENIMGSPCLSAWQMTGNGGVIAAWPVGIMGEQRMLPANSMATIVTQY